VQVWQTSTLRRLRLDKEKKKIDSKKKPQDENIFHRVTITSGQSNLTTGRIAAAQRRFNGIRQVAPVCTSPNPWAHPIPNIPNGISIDSADFARLMAESPYFTIGHPFSP